MKPDKRFWLGVLVCLFVLAGASAVLAQSGGEELPPGVTLDDVYRVSRKMYCDVCAGVPVSDCPSPTCALWRQEVADLLGQGYTDDQILRIFAERYGDKISGVPLQEDDRTLALGLPILIGVFAFGLIGWQIWRLRQRGDTRALQAARSAGLLADYARPVPDNVNPEYLQRFLDFVEGSRS
jgi:cytochrome c-type biogenesis protein CcmH/NrfF